MKTTRTVNPLHFEDLEPHRFEDLVRQLAYSFKTWKSIEATGRLGSDEGMDIRAVELAADKELTEGELNERESDLADSNTPSGIAERLWIIQCKRERTITPKRIRNILSESLESQRVKPYGFILAASAEFSKKTRDTFYQVTRSLGVQEAHIWGKSDLEDRLFLAQNDHLLFAYFGFSLQIHRRSMKTALRSRISMKRQLCEVFGEPGQPKRNTPVLIRDPSETRYPYAHEIPDFHNHPLWRYYYLIGHEPPDHLAFVYKRYLAYIDGTGDHWDAILTYDDGFPAYPSIAFQEPRTEQTDSLCSWWFNNVAEKNRAYYIEARCIHYDRILVTDKHGDCYHPGPHILTEFTADNGPFEPKPRAIWVEPSLWFAQRLTPTKENHIDFFPRSIPDQTA